MFTISLVNIHYQYIAADFFLVIRTFKIYSFSNFQIHDTVNFVYLL